MSPLKMSFYHAQASKCPLSRKWQWMATWPIIYRYGDRCEILLEHPCHQYRIDIYFPDLRLAIEIDEAHHNSPENAAKDAERQDAIVRELGCTFRRLKVDGEEGSLYDQLAVMMMFLDEQTRDLPPWAGPNPPQRRSRTQRAAGEYSVNNLQELDAAGIPDIVAQMVEQLSALGINTHDIGEPLSVGNGEMGFAIDLPGITLVVSVRSPGTIKTLVVGEVEVEVVQRLGIELEGPRKPNSNNPYWEVVGMRRGNLTIDQTLTRLVQFNDLLNVPGAEPEPEGD